MDSPKKNKTKHRFSPAEAADYLRQLADALEQGHLELRSEDLELEGDVKVKQELKTKSGKATLKVNLKIVAPMPQEDPGDDPAQGEAQGFVEISSPEDEPAESEGKTSYKKLKKAMGKSFSSLKDVRKAGNMPAATEAASFMAQAREMCTFDKDKYGPEHYPRFMAALDRMESALAAGNPQALDEALEELGQCKSECHDKYK